MQLKLVLMKQFADVFQVPFVKYLSSAFSSIMKWTTFIFFNFSDKCWWLEMRHDQMFDELLVRESISCKE